MRSVVVWESITPKVCVVHVLLKRSYLGESLPTVDDWSITPGGLLDVVKQDHSFQLWQDVAKEMGFTNWSYKGSLVFDVEKGDSEADQGWKVLIEVEESSRKTLN